MRLFALAFVACASTSATPVSSVDAAVVEGSGMRIELDGDRIARITPVATTAFISPSVIDSHVHLAYWSVADQIAKAGIGGAVDLAAPERALPMRGGPHTIFAGPMLTRPGGYPLDSWGSDGYGIECADAACIDAAIDRLAKVGARVVKLALDENSLDNALVPHAIAVAHARKMKVAVHALLDRSAALAARAGADLLAHTPIQPLRPETIAAWRGRAVVSTLAAFGGSASAIANLRALREAGAIVLYGTDLGNLRDAGPSGDEIDLLKRAGLDDRAIVDAMTTVPARFWDLRFGEITVGAEATFLVLDRDPKRDATVLATPQHVYLRGRRLR